MAMDVHECSKLINLIYYFFVFQDPRDFILSPIVVTNSIQNYGKGAKIVMMEYSMLLKDET